MTSVMPHDSLLRAACHADAQNLAVLATQVFVHTYATDGISRTIAGHVIETFTAARFSASIADPMATVWAPNCMRI